MITFDEVGAILDAIADELPHEFYNKLNGGVVLLPDVKFHPASENRRDLYIMGEYTHDPRGLGRYIAIYYGSFVRLYGNSPPDAQKEQLRKVLLHEFTHHLESLAGERGLEIKDKLRMDEYKRRYS